MPRIYMTPQEFSQTILGITLAGQLNQLPPGSIDQILAGVSQRVDSRIEKRLQAPGSTTLTGNVSANASSINVASTLTLDELDEQAVMLDVGLGTQETVLIQPGGVTVTSWQSPYPGTLALATPLQFGHSNGASVQYVYQEVDETPSASMSDPWSEALESQAAQLALAHLPPVHTGLNRIQFLKNYPIINVYEVDHAYSFTTTYNVIYQSGVPSFVGGIIIEPASGWFRYNIGSVVLPQGLTRTTYTAGYQAIPDDVKRALVCYLKDEFQQFANPYGAVDSTMGKRKLSWAKQGGKSPNVQDAEAYLERFRRRT